MLALFISHLSCANSLLFLNACYLKLCEFTLGLYIPGRMSHSCLFHSFTICFPLFLYPSFLDPLVFPPGCCSSALELSCWKCQKLAFSPCRETVVVPHLLNTLFVCTLEPRWTWLAPGWMLCVCWKDGCFPKKLCFSLPLSKINRPPLLGFTPLFALSYPFLAFLTPS